jgi:LysM repeat protein
VAPAAAPAAAPETDAAAPRVHMKLHTVEVGEDLNTIAMMYGVNITDLQKANSLQGTEVKAGQILKVPMAE